jgi:hypothetical protein
MKINHGVHGEHGEHGEKKRIEPKLRELQTVRRTAVLRGYILISWITLGKG